ncbi:MAG: DUF1569 domain-containing protein [Bacteroidota bacterium]|jgi:hypothetical protein
MIPGHAQRELFLKKQCVPALRSIAPSATPLFGKMNAQQMAEHLFHSIEQSNGRNKASLVSDPEKLPALQVFLRSDKLFRPNTSHPLLSEAPAPTEMASMEDACDAVETALYVFFDRFSGRTHEHETHPVFGQLVYEDWVTMHFKHFLHHLSQFGVEFSMEQLV